MTATLSSSKLLKTLMRPAPLKNETEEANEQHIAYMSESIRNAETLDQFMSHLNQLKSSRVFNDQSQQIDQSGVFGSPIKRNTMSAGFRSPTSAGFMSPYSAAKVFNAFENFDSSDEEECTFHPQINQNASKLSKKPETNLSVNEYLYNYATEKKAKHQENKDIHDMKRTQKMTESKINKKSIDIILKKLNNALKNLISHAEKQDAEGKVCFESLGTVLHQIGVFQNLEFVAPENDGEKSVLSINHTKVKPERLAKEIAFHENFWKILTLTSNDEKSVNSEVVLKFLVILVEEKSPVSDAGTALNEYLNGLLEKANKANLSELIAEKSLWNLEKLITEFRKLFDDKTSFMKIYSASNQLQTKTAYHIGLSYTHSFRPQTNSRSKKLDINHLNRTLSPKMASIDPNWQTETPIKRNERLYAYHRYLSDKKNHDLESRIEDELKPCTFSPRVKIYKKPTGKGHATVVDPFSPSRNHYYNQTMANSLKGNERHHAMYEVAKTYKEIIQQKAYTLKKKDELKEMKPCTFEPKLNRYYETSPVRHQAFNEAVPNGYKKSVARLHKGYNGRKQYETELNKVPRGEDYHKNKNAEFKSPKMLDRSKIKKEEALVYVDVSIGPGKTGRIGIHKGDNAKSLANNFAKTYSLNATMKTSLEGLLQSYIDSYFAQINVNPKQEVEHNKNNKESSHEEEEDIEGVDEAKEDEEDEREAH